MRRSCRPPASRFAWRDARLLPPGADTITLPDRVRFAQAEDYYATALHELCHATKHPTRCDRKRYAHENSKVSYAFEELVAKWARHF